MGRYISKSNTLIFALILQLLCIGSARAALIDFTGNGAGSGFAGANYTVGYSFTLSDSVTFDALGVLDFLGTGLSASHDVGIWTAGGDLLRTATVGPTSSIIEAAANGIDNYVYAPIESLTLDAGTYMLAAHWTSQADIARFGVTGIFSNDPAATYNNGFVQTSSTSLEFPTISQDGTRYFGPAIRVSPVPLPAAFPLFASALGLMGFLRRHRRKVA